MINMFTVATKGGNNGNEWNGMHPEKFFPVLRKNGIKSIFDVRRSNEHPQYCTFFCKPILPWCCEHDGIHYEHRLDLAPAKELYQQCDAEKWNLLQYTHAYFTTEIVAALKIIPLESLDNTAILCAEQELYNCHRLLVVEFLKAYHTEETIIIKHLGLAYDRYGREKNGVPADVMQATREYIKGILTK